MMAASAASQLQDASHLTEVSTPVEVVALPEVFSLVEKANLQALSASLQFKDLYDEVCILQRLTYKNNNQHRASKHYQSVRQVLKALQLFQQLQLPTLLQHLHTAAARTSLPEASTAAGSSERARRQQQQQPQHHTAAQRQTVRLPSLQSGSYVLRRLLSGAQLLLDLHYVILSAGQHLSGQLSRGYFMPFCLVATAAVARIRVLAITGLLELLQAYNSLAQLLPLLPAASPAAANITSSSSSSSSFLALNTDGLPQMLQLSWNGPLPALRSIPFEDQGPQSLQALAAELQQTYCISSTSSSGGGGNRDSLITTKQLSVGGLDQQDCRQQSAAGEAAGADVGMAISREAFAQQLGQQQQRQQQPRPKIPLQGQQRAPRQSKQQQQQQGHAPAFSISFFEDKQPQQAAVPEPTAAGNITTEFPQQPSVAVPLYSTVPGLGFSLGQQLKTCMPVALGTAAAAASSQAVGGPEHISAVGSARGPQAMEVDEISAEDQQEILFLYGKQPTPTQQRQPQQQQQQQQQQQTRNNVSTAGQPVATATAAAAAAAGHPAAAAVGVHRGLQASAGLLAMQQCHSSDADDDMGVAQPVAAAVQHHVSGMVLPTIQGLQRQQQQQQLAAALPAAVAQPVAAAAAGGGVALPSTTQMLQQQQQQQVKGYLAMQQVAAAVPASGRGRGPPKGQRQSQQASQRPSQPAAAAAALDQMPAQPASAARVMHDLAGSAAARSSSRQAAGKDVPTLQANKKGRQKKKALGKQQAAAEASQDAPAAAPRDSILDMLLQGL